MFKKVLFFSIFVSFVFASCGNFMQGSNISTEIEAAVEDAKLDRYDVTVFAYNNQGTLKGETGGTYKVGGESYVLDFSENKGWQFAEWQVLDKAGNKTGCTSSDSIYIKNPLSAKTIFSITGAAAGYRIEAVCMARPNVEVFSPSYIANGINGDSPIEITFAHEVDEESFVFSEAEFAAYGKFAKAIRMDLQDASSAIVGIELAGDKIYKNISITDSNGNNLSSHYKAPVLSANKTKVTLEADTSKPFDFSSSSTKDVFVILSSKISYDYKAQNEKAVKIVPEKKYDFNYKVSATTTAKARITLSAKNEEDKVMGTLNYNGQQDFNIGQTVKIEFVPNNDFEFVGWDIQGNEDNAVSVKADGTAFVMNVLKATDSVKIVPVCREKGVAEITIHTKVGTIEHTEAHTFRVGDEFTVTINHDSLYYFPGWKIRNPVINGILSDEDRDIYFYSDDWSKETTTIKVMSECTNLIVDGGVYYRPFINLREPVNTPEGTNRDQNIKVHFDKAIDPMSLYYTDEELAVFEHTYGQYYKGSMKYRFVGENACYYATNFNNELHYRNITIIDNNTGKNLSQYFDIPYLEPNGKTLIIPVVKKYDKNGKLLPEYLPPANTEISVEIGTGFTHLENGVSIPLERNSNSNWFYTTNAKTDDKTPSVGSHTISGTNLTASFVIGTGQSLGKTKPSTLEEYKKVYLKDNKLKISADITDESKNFRTAYLSYKHVANDKYVEIGSLEKKITLGFARDENDPTLYHINNYEVDFTGFDSGLYEIWISGQDEVNNEGLSDKYYVLIDNVGPAYNKTIDYSKMKFFRNGTKMKFCDWTEKTGADRAFDYVSSTMYVSPRYSDSDTTTYPMGTDPIILNLDANAQIQIKIVASDAFGNTTVVYNSGVGKDYYYYKTILQNNDYLYEDGWFSPGPYNSGPSFSGSWNGSYAGYKVYGQYVEKTEGNYIVYKNPSPLEMCTLSAANSKLAELNAAIPTALRGKINWTYAPVKYPFGELSSITGVSTFADNDAGITSYFYGFTSSGGMGLMTYKPGYSGYPYDISLSNKAYLVAVSALPAGGF